MIIASPLVFGLNRHFFVLDRLSDKQNRCVLLRAQRVLLGIWQLQGAQLPLLVKAVPHQRRVLTRASGLAVVVGRSVGWNG